MKRQFLTAAEVAELLRCSLRSVQERTRAGRIPHWKIAGQRPIVYPVDQIEAWIHDTGAELERVESVNDGSRLVRVKL